MMTRPTRLAAGLLLLAAALGGALILPIPTVTDPERVALRRTLDERLPGWQVDRLHPSWEGAYTVVTRCGGRSIEFQLVPGHGLSPNDAWLLPADEYTRERLTALSDHWRHLIWFDDPAMSHQLSCSEELARARRSGERLDSTFD